MRNKDRIKIDMGSRIFRTYQRSGFYVQRMLKSGHCGGYLTHFGGWSSNFERAQCFKTRDEAFAAFKASNARSAWVIQNINPNTLKKSAVDAIESGRLPYTGSRVLARIEAAESIHCPNCGPNNGPNRPVSRD